MKVSIIIPAHNEEQRIGSMLAAYHEFFLTKSREDNQFSYEFVVVLNGCRDATRAVVEHFKTTMDSIVIIDISEAGKGLAVKHGFENALTRTNDLIGFVDADMATRPLYFFELIERMGIADGVIAGRYMNGSQIFPPRPFVKEWGRRIVYQPLVKMLFGLTFYDNQCGAKLFKRSVIEAVVPSLTVKQWAFDVELLYICKKLGFSIKELPTVWYDQKGSKLKLMQEHRMITSLVKVRWKHTWLHHWLQHKL